MTSKYPEFQYLDPPVVTKETTLMPSGRHVSWIVLFVVWLIVAILVYFIIVYANPAWAQGYDTNGNATGKIDQGKVVGISILVALVVAFIVWILLKK